MIKITRIAIIIASVTIALSTRSAIFFAVPLAFECAVKFYQGYTSA